MRRHIVLDERMVRVATTWGQRVVEWYAEDPERAARAGEWGAELDPIRQSHAKAGEYAAAVCLSLDPALAVKRNVKIGVDGGYDLLITETIKADVKTSVSGKRWVLWSLAINDLYWQKDFDVIIGCSVRDDDLSQCWVEGYMTKQEFFDRKKIADGINDGGKLTPGTWFVEKAELHPIGKLLAGFVGYGPTGLFIHYCPCGVWGPHGYGVSVRTGKLGHWFCTEHKPDERRPDDVGKKDGTEGSGHARHA